MDACCPSEIQRVEAIPVQRQPRKRLLLCCLLVIVLGLGSVMVGGVYCVNDIYDVAVISIYGTEQRFVLD